MTFEVDIDGGTWTVSIAPVGAAGPAGGRFHITVQPPDAQTVQGFGVDARRTDLGLSLVSEDARRVVDAAITARPGGEYFVQLPHIDIVAAVDSRRLRRGRSGSAEGHGEQRVTAPMPGRVLRVLVRPGDEVQTRQGLVVIEAMKMENELTALRPGRVREVHVTEGTSVESGRLLVVID